MSTQVQRRKGTTAQHATFTGASAELTVDTTKNTVVVHDGATAGGIPLAKETGSAISATSLTSSGASVISVTDNTNAALRITQLGTGNALLVEDSANPDSSPFVIDNSGRTILGTTSSISVSGTSPPFQFHTPGAGASYTRWSSNASGCTITIAKSRSATIGTYSTVSNADQIGALNFVADDGTTLVTAASISANVDGTPSTNDMPGRLVFSTTADGASSPTERMRLDSSGNLGIGTSSPGASLHVAGTITGAPTGSGLLAGIDAGYGVAQLNGTNGSIIDFSASGVDFYGRILYTNATNVMSFFTNTSERMRLDASGNLLVGTTSSPAAASALGKIVRVGGVNIEGTNQITVGTTFVDITKDINTGTFVYVSGYRSPGGQQAVWVLLAQGTTVNVISTINASIITASFQIAGGKVQMKASADAFVICAASLTTNL